jgi:hypothetical protein
MVKEAKGNRNYVDAEKRYLALQSAGPWGSNYCKYFWYGSQ